MKTEDMAQRLEHLERSLRRVKVAAAVIVVAACALALLGQAGPQKTVIAERFVMQDPQGRQRLIIGMIPEGPTLGIYDERGVARLFMAIAKDRPFVSLNDGNNKARAELAVDSGQNAVLKLRDARENERLAAGVDEKGVAQVKFSDEKRSRMSLGMLPGGSAMAMFDENGKPRVLLTCLGQDKGATEGKIMIWDADGKALTEAP